MDVPVTPRLTYVEFLPPADLAAWVESISLLDVPLCTPRRLWYRIPDARARLALPRGSGRATLLPPVFTRSVAPAPAPNSYVVVRFAPWATGPLRLTRDLSGALWHGLGIHCSEGEFDVLDVYSKVAAKLRMLLETRYPEARVIDAWRMLSRNPQASVDAVARACGISARSLLRSMQDASHCTIRTARTLQRLHRALRLLRSDLSLSWSRAALSAGYFDQAHFTRTFRHLVGLSPTRFFEEGHHHFNDVFARSVHPSGSPPVVAVGYPVLRGRHERHQLARDGRRRPRSSRA